MSNPKSSQKTVNSISKTIDKTNPMTSLRTKLKMADSEIKNYVTALESENLKLQKHIAKLQAQNVSLNNRVTILKENLNEEPNLMATVVAALGKIKHDKPPKK
jgi:hypothetical protein